MKSFQIHVNWKSTSTAIGPRASGIRIRHRIVQLFAPSSFAASSMSVPTVEKKPRMTNRQNGVAIAE